MAHRKILIVAGNFYPSTLGGPSRSLYWLSSTLLRHEVEVCVVTTNSHINKNIVQVDCWNDVDKLQVFYASSKLNLIKKSFKAITTHDVVLLSSICYLPSSAVAVWSTLKRKKIVWAPRGELFNSAIDGNKAKNIYFGLLRLLFGKIVLWQATSDEEQVLIRRYFGRKASSVVLPNYMCIPTRMQRMPTEPYFLYVGRVAPIKALDKVVRGLAMSKCFMTSQYKFAIIGDIERQFESYGYELKRIIGELDLSDRIIFVGSLYGKEKNQAFANAYMTILLSNSENFGNVVIESLAQGTPVIASQGTPWQVLNKTQSGYWVDNTPQVIADTIDNALKLSEGTYNDYRDNAIKLANTFDIEKNVRKWIKILDEC